MKEEQQRKGHRPEKQGDDNAADTLAVKVSHSCRTDREKEYTGHHDKQRYAAAHGTSQRTSLQESRAVGIKTRNKGITTMGEHNQKTGHDAQHVHPSDSMLGFYSHDGKCLKYVSNSLRAAVKEVVRPSSTSRSFSNSMEAMSGLL